jgi:anti-sigma B factor antagonist
MTASPLTSDVTGLDVRIVTRGRLCTVTVTGEVDALTAGWLREQLLGVLTGPDVAELDVDLRPVTFLGAAGLATLVVLHQSAGTAGRVLRLRCGSSRAVRRPMQVTGLWNALPVVEA